MTEAKDVVYLVEMRQRDSDLSRNFFSTVSFVGSSKEKAVEFCRDNQDYEEHNEEYVWWWAISREVVDCENTVTSSRIVRFLDWYGNEIKEQPIDID